MDYNYENSENEHGNNILIGIIFAIVIGAAIGGWMPEIALKFSMVGTAFLYLLKMIVVPLVILSMVIGITGLGDVRHLGSIGWRTVLYYMLTTVFSVLVGLFLVNIIQPGKGISEGEKHEQATYELSGENLQTVTLDRLSWQRNYNDKYSIILLDQNVQGEIAQINENSVTVKFWDYYVLDEELFYIETDLGDIPFRSIDGQVVSALPELEATGTGVEVTLPIARKLQGKEERKISNTLGEVLLGNEATGKQGLIPNNIFKAMVQMDILPLIVFSLLLGAALTTIGSHGDTAIELISALNDSVMKIVNWIVALAPIGILGLIAARIGKAGGFDGFLPELAALGKYCLTVILGLSIHGFIVLPLILLLVGKRNPLDYVAGMATALLNAFSTASSSATLPLTMQGVEHKNQISNRTASFVLPLGATINMDGTALYEAVAAMFIAQVYGIEVGLVGQVVIFLTATLAAIGAAGIPEAGLVTMVIVLRAVGLPIEGIGLILAVDWFLDRFRTTVNVWGDSVGAGVIETLEGTNEDYYGTFQVR